MLRSITEGVEHIVRRCEMYYFKAPKRLYKSQLENKWCSYPASAPDEIKPSGRPTNVEPRPTLSNFEHQHRHVLFWFPSSSLFR